MIFTSMQDYLARGRATLATGPVALVLVEDGVEVDTTLRHAVAAGFGTVLALGPATLPLPDDLGAGVHHIVYDTAAAEATSRAVNAVIDAAPAGTWVHYCYNAEYLFHPFCETRNVKELLAFHAEERRDAMLTYVIDVYAADLDRHPGGVDRASAMLDGTGYYALAREAQGQRPDRQLDFFGGLKWRFEEHVPPDRRRIDRIGLFRTKPGLRLREDHTFSDPEYNTYACPWHHNLTAAILSFRAAKALRANPGSQTAIRSFRWSGSVPVAWSSRQLMDLGLMEPGQWF